MPGLAAMKFSVVVSTCNRASELPRLFAALQGQTINGRTAWELIIVDNRSTDGTAQAVNEFATQAAFPVTYRFEGRKGKSHGLNTGIELARGDIIAFTDDDGIPAADWLENIERHFAARPDLVCIGGRVELYNPDDALVTVRLSKEPCSVDASGCLAQNMPVIGVNLAIKAAALRSAGPYDVDLGPGSRTGVAEDLDMLYRLVSAGHQVHYEPEILVFHNHGRRLAHDVKRVRDGYAIGRGAFYCKYLLQRDRRVVQWAYWETVALLSEWARARMVTAQARDALRALRLLMVGVIRYLRFRHTSAPAMGPHDAGTVVPGAPALRAGTEPTEVVPNGRSITPGGAGD